jgi:hypothetical protein
MFEDPLDALRRRAEGANQQAVKAEQQRLDAQRAEARRQAEQAAARRRRARRAPGTFTSSVRFVTMLLIGATLWMTTGMLWLDSDFTHLTKPLFAAGLGWCALFGGLWLDALTWRFRLPFPVEGDLEIHGEDPAGDSHVPFRR